MLFTQGPIAQLGERFNGIEEVKSSSLFRSNPVKSSKPLSSPLKGFFHRKASAVAKTKRNVLDDIADGVREILRDFDRLLNPQQQKPARVLVPIPIRKQQQRPRPDR
jgi:hypothetical protein